MAIDTLGLYIEDKYRKCGYGSQLSLRAFKMSEPIENLSLYTLPVPYIVEMYKKYYGVHEILLKFIHLIQQQP